MAYNLKEKLIETQNDLPKKQQKVCKFIINQIDEASTMTIAQLSEKSGVGTTTILRFIQKVGYKKYPCFKNDLIKYNFDNKTNTWWHLKKSLEELDGDDNDEVSLIKVGKNSIEDIEGMLRKINIDDYKDFLNIILNANNVHFLGLRTSKSLALYFEQMLKGILNNVNQLSMDPDLIYDDSLNFKKEDTLVVIALSPYTKRTMDFVKYCKNSTDISIALIVDLETSPLIQYSDAHLVVGQNNNRYSVIPAITLMESLIIDFGRKNPSSVEKISKMNDIHRHNDITTI